MHARAGSQGSDGPLYGLCNNAGIGFGRDVPTTLATNLYGAKRVSDSFVPLIADGGRVCNIASASGPIIEACDDCRFAAYACTWSGVHAEQMATFVKAGAWKDVQDFKWLKTAANPHWRELGGARDAAPLVHIGHRHWRHWLWALQGAPRACCCAVERGSFVACRRRAHCVCHL